MSVRLQPRCSANADALKIAGLADRSREAALPMGGRAMLTVSVIRVIPAASR